MAPETCGGRRRTKKHKRHTRRRYTRGGFTAASLKGVENYPGGHVDVRSGVTMSGSNFETLGYNGSPSGLVAYGGRRRGRKTRRRRRSMRGGSDGSRVFSSFAGESVGGTAPGSAVHSGVATGVQPY
jgi:hypothetical protein